MSRAPIVTFDFETFYSSSCSLTELSYTDYVFHPEFRVHGAAYMIEDGERGWLGPDEIPAFLEAHAHDTFLFHNGHFDVSVLLFTYGFMPHRILDTMLLARLFDGFVRDDLSLGGLADHYKLGRKGDAIHNFKGVVELEGELLESVKEYAINDVVLTKALFDTLVEKYVGIFGGETLRNEIRILDATVRLIKPALRLDEGLIVQAIHDEACKAQEAFRGISNVVGLPVEELLKTVRSRDKFANLLVRMGVAVPTKLSKKTGRRTFAFAKGDDAFVKLVEAYKGTPIGGLLELKREASSRIKATRAKRFKDAHDNCGGLPIYLNYAGAQQTLRFSGGNKMNAQNLPRGSFLRRAVIPPSGHKLVIADFSAIEARVLAWLSGDEALLQQFRNGEDVYVKAVAPLWGDITGADGEPDSAKRFVGKCMVLSLGYGAGWTALESVMRTGALGTPFVFNHETALTVIESAEELKKKLRDMYENNRDKFDGYAFLLMSNPELLWHFAACEMLVSTYRAERTPVLSLWKQADPRRLVNIDSGWIGGNVRFTHEYDDVIMHLPGGTKLVYHDLHRSNEGDGFVYTLAGVPKYTYGGKIVENICQSVARNLMVYAWVNCLDAGYTPVWSVHDELVFIAKDEDAERVAKDVARIMVRNPEWAADLPLGVKTSVADTYAEK